MSRAENDGRLADYLLGKLPEEEQERLEQEYLADDSRYEDVLAVEDELLVEYARGELEPADRARVEARLLRTDQDRERLAWARSLVTWFDTSRVPASPERLSWKYGLAAAALIAVAFAALLAQNLSLRRQVQQAEAARATAVQALADGQRTPPAGNAAAPAPEPPLVVSLSLAPGLERSSGAMPRITVPAAAATLRLDLKRPAGLVTGELTAILRDVDGRTLWTGPASNLGPTITVNIDASRLATGDYEVVLRDRRDRAEYYFSAIR
jgi:hypothetical protein